jgi:hypothetical protein
LNFESLGCSLLDFSVSHTGDTLIIRTPTIGQHLCVPIYSHMKCKFWVYQNTEAPGAWTVSWCNKSKAVPLQAWSGPESSRKLRFLDFMTTAQDGGKVVSLRHWPLYPQEILLVLISVRGRDNPRAIVRPARLCHWQIPMTPSGIEPATCRFVA